MSFRCPQVKEKGKRCRRRVRSKGYFCSSHKTQDNLHSLYNKAVSYRSTDEKKAFEYYKLAADQGHAKSQNSLGIFYDFGIACEKDQEKAFKYYKLAADQGHARAQCNLAHCYMYGSGCRIDDTEAYKYFLMSAKQGNEEAERIISSFYSELSRQ